MAKAGQVEPRNEKSWTELEKRSDISLREDFNLSHTHPFFVFFLLIPMSVIKFILIGNKKIE